ncbi:MAG: ATP-dependent helicase, partial [Pseudomonas sp.]|nr:ATP-dependent helicase [Pseudomonas sp.]
MLSAVARYKQLLSSALARYFPRTTAYLRAEHEAAQPRKPVRKQSKKKSTGNKKAGSRKTASGKPGPAGIYPATRLKIEDAQVQAMRERVAQAVSAGLIGAPSDEQWAMILCRAPLARIFAGAGSGKSSTLVLRVVFLLCHLEIEPKRLTVISFTNASCHELRERLQRLLDFWHYPHDARQCVRTFHAAMATLAKESLGNPRWFEQLDEPGDEPDNPLAGTRLRPAQQRLLKQAYQNAYADDARFRVLTHRLLKLPAPEEPPQGKAKASLDACKLPGEFAALPLFELLHGQIDFAESLGIRLDRLDVKTLACGPRERDFIEAMQRFHQHFSALLHSQGLI